MSGLKQAVRNTAKIIMFKGVYPLCYKVSSLRPLRKNKVIFAEIRSGTLTDSFRYIYEEVKTRGLDPQVYYVHNNKGGMGYLLRYLKLTWLMGNVGCVLLNDTCNLFGAFKFRKDTKVIQTWHSCGAFKKWGESITDLSFGESLEELRKFPAHTSYTLCTVSSKECIWAFKEAFGFDLDNNSVQAIGVSRTDFFFKEENRVKAFENLYKNCPNAQYKKVLLYAPTYRGDADKAYIPEKLDIKALKENFGSEWVLLVKRHGFVKKEWDIPEDCQDFAFDITEHMPIEDLLFTADMCITDYSSLIFEYSLFERPMIFYAFDLDEFYDYRGFYYPYDYSFLPGPIVKTNEELINAIKHRSRRNAESDTYPLIDPCHVEDDEHHEDGQQAAREDEEVLRLQAPELHALADSLVDSIFHNYLHDRLDYKKKERRIVAATIRKIHAPNQLAAVFDVSGSPLENLL